MKYWIINRVLDFKEREILMITLEAAGYEIYQETRLGTYSKDYPYIGTAPHDSWSIVGFRQIYDNMNRNILTYEEVICELHKIIKNERD